ncbi:3-dehydroquinate synthase [Ichthyenterobacterium sp. W332]|uniref:3-dehydroquinate synthase n=1 Tax=Microcosmobacter mediterraneus TaxID=3075607 RepID=A0ABU2YLY8_9FLAO|nr:3-dehydroquinate synthase [Ichthyenterobacterium sp. W332]MDT0558719.1 3-dehydroquinate synthase [Ichthyenterobacterium sp. W332]
MNSILAKDCEIHFNIKAYEVLKTHLAEKNYSKVVVIVDENTHQSCLPLFLSRVESDIVFDIIEIEAGEMSKTIDTCTSVWEALSDLGFDRKSLIINLGGGVVTDLGGFVACTFKRGINYINIPTSLLAMVDASVGGKTGVDLGVIKNQIGVIATGEMVIIDTEFLATLPQNHLRSGLAEMLKHGLIADRKYWDTLSDLSQLHIEDLEQLIYESVIIKNNIVNSDPNEDGVRKYLNFGHTLGHAIESYFLDYDAKEELLHGEAVAIGMILESYLSYKLLDLSKEDLATIKTNIQNLYGKISIDEDDYEHIIELLKFDKKNSHGVINFVLLEAIGKPKYDCQAENALIIEAFEYYKA